MPTPSASRRKRLREHPPRPAAVVRSPAPKRAATSRRVAPWAWLALFLIVVAAYAPTLGADFVNWDDAINVYENPRVTEPGGVAASWTRTENPEFLPLTYTTFWLEWRLSGGAPWLFHLDNVLLHAGNAVLAGLLAETLGLPLAASWLGAALWALHPVHVMSVAWVTERKNVLYVFWWLDALLLYVRATDRAPRAGAQRTAPLPLIAASLACFVLAILSKRAAITLPAAIVLVEWLRGGLDRRSRPQSLRMIAAFAAVALAGGLMLLTRVPNELAGPPLPLRILVACHALWFYVASFFWPVGLLAVYPRWSPTEVTAISWLALASVLAAAVAIALAWRRIPRLALFGFGLFVSNAALVVGLVWFTFLRFSLVSDHLAYLPFLGLALATVTVLWTLAAAMVVDARTVAVAVGLWCALLAVATWRHSGVWRDSQTLWETTLARNPDCTPCLVNLGMLIVDDDPEAAAAHYERAFALDPDGTTLRRIGYARASQGRNEEAADAYRRAIAMNPRDADAHYGLANAFRRAEQWDPAITEYQITVGLDPGNADAHHNFGLALLGAGRLDEAKARLEEALGLHPRDTDAELALAAVAQQRGDTATETRWYETALQHASDASTSAVVHAKFAEALTRAGRLADAATHLEAAVKSTPDDGEIVISLANVRMQQGRAADAIAVLQQAVRRAPNEPALVGALAWNLATVPDAGVRNGAEAVRLAEHVSTLAANDADLLDTLAAAYAETGRFPDAVRTAERALAIDGASDAAAQVRERLAGYRSGKPYHQPAPAGDGQ